VLPFEHTTRPYEDGWSISRVLTDSLHLAERAVRQLERERRVRLNRAPASVEASVSAYDVITVLAPRPAVAGIEPTPMALDVAYEDAWLLVVNKPPYLLVHPTQPGQVHTLVNGLAHYYHAQGSAATIHPVHRLDQDTSGLVLFGKTPAAHERVGRQLKDHSLRRRYLAFLHGAFPEDVDLVDAPIGRHPTQAVLRAVRGDGEPARTRVHVVERYAAATLVELELETGRTHQIRVHMAHLGYPLLGDRQYGRKGRALIRRQALHAARLTCRHPESGETLDVRAPLPADLVELRARLRG
jgi:RluA family pseudouridine synthase